MKSLRTTLPRRSFLAAAAGGAAALAARETLAAPLENVAAAFFLIGDTHFLANKESPGEIDEASLAVTERLIDVLNRLPGEAIPEAAGGGVVRPPRGVIHAGDLIDSGDKNGRLYEQMQETEWRAYTAHFGLTGADGRLKHPIFEVHGNHDSPASRGHAIDGIIERNKRRPGLAAVAPNGLHCSWDWGGVHFVNLGIVVGQDPAVTQRRRYQPAESLDFLIADLEAHVGDSGRPVVLTHHIDVARYTGPCDPENPQNLGKEWNPCDVRSYFHAIRKYNVAAILYGHTHARAALKWDGETARAERGFNLFNVDNSGHFHGQHQAFFYFEIAADELLVRECFTNDAWRTAQWTPQVWRQPVGLS